MWQFFAVKYTSNRVRRETQVYVKSLHSHHHDDDYLPDASFLTLLFRYGNLDVVMSMIIWSAINILDG